MVKLSTKILLSLAFISLLILVPLFAVLNFNATNNKLEKPLVTDLNPSTLNTTDFNGIIAYANVTSVTSTVVSMHFTLTPNIRNTTDAIVTPFSAIVNSKTVAFSALDILPNLDATFAVLSGSTNSYPFDSYTIFGTLVFFQTSSNIPLGAAVQLVGAVDQWELLDGTVSNLDAVNVVIALEFGRSFSAKFFALFLAFLMWVIALSSISVSISIWIRGRKVEPPTIAVAGALLFALPAVRNSWPGNPPVGTTLDAASFYWAMLLVSISLISLMINYVVSTKIPSSSPSEPSSKSVSSKTA